MIHFVFQLVIWLFSMFVIMYVIGLSWTPFHSFHPTHIYYHSTILLVCIMYPIWRLSSVLLSLSFHVDWQVCWLFPLALLFHKWRPIHVNWNHNYKYLECLDMVWLCRMSVLCLLLNMNWYLWCPINYHNQQSSVVIQILCAKHEQMTECLIAYLCCLHDFLIPFIVCPNALYASSTYKW